jgi:prepilin-type N-terminal cleavage/methylation domain-containing protein
MPALRTCRTRGNAGFTLLELIMALTVLTFGVLGLASTTLIVTRELTVAETTTERTAVLQSVMERIRATPYNLISSGSDTIGPMMVSWTSTATSGQTTVVEIVSVGPGLAPASVEGQPPALSGSVTDTILYTVLRP